MKEKIKNWFKNNWFKVIAIGFLLGALADNPYSYYQFLRWVILIVGGITTFLYFEADKKTWAWTFGIITLIFNPIIPFHFSRDFWQFIDVVVAIIFFVSFFIKLESKKDEK